MEIERKRLNQTYYPLYTKSVELVSVLRRHGFAAELGWYNGHYHRDESGQFQMDYFPIPVIRLKGFCDIEFDIAQISISSKLKRNNALHYTFEKMKNISFEAFGVEDYLASYYDSNMTIKQLHKNIQESRENDIGFSFSFSLNISNEDLLAFVKFLRCEGFFY